MSLRNSILIIAIVLLVDQFIKIYIKTNFFYNETIDVTSWFKIMLIENEGMAWGAKIPGAYGKLALTCFRILAVFGLAYWLYDASIKHSSTFLMVSISLIFAGAVGNIIDSVFYGMLFSSSDFGTIATLFPTEGGYASILYGKVVDMFYFPLFSGTFPEWLPIWGGEHFLFFRPVFNIADASITSGVIIWILFQKKIYPEENKTSTDEVESPTDNSILENN